jgi:hypothetical protein
MLYDFDGTLRSPAKILHVTWRIGSTNIVVLQEQVAPVFLVYIGRERLCYRVPVPKDIYLVFTRRCLA